jgi:Bacterial protein of unknown function (DUF885)
MIFLLAASVFGESKTSWIERSNQNSKLLLDTMAKFAPEFAGYIGAEGVDEMIVDLKPGIQERYKQALQNVEQELEKRLTNEKDPSVHQDLEILIKRCKESIHEIELNDQYLIPYQNIPQIIFLGIQTLLDDRVSESRRPASLVRLKRYAGIEEGYSPITKLAVERTKEKLSQPRLNYPSKAEIEKDLLNSPYLVKGIEDLFKKYSIQGYEESFAKLKEQVVEYEDYLKKEILPKARTDFRLPRPLYEFSLEQVGVDIPAEQLATQAHQAFNEIQKQMSDLANRIAKEKGLASASYLEIIQDLKKKQLVGDAILLHYQSRIKEIEGIIRREKLVTLPQREMVVRLSSEAESAAQPAPHMKPPRLIGNTGEQGEFVLPLNFPAKSEGQKLQYDDFTFEAASWTLTAHEGRPGHELQFASIIETGVSIARGLFAFNSVNVEGWGLYSESIMQPYEPLEGQLVTLQHRLMRAARAFLDPELQFGKIQPEEAKRILKEDVVLSEAMSNQEVERYMFRAPGQAPSYFYGYTKLRDLRNEIETKLGKKLNIMISYFHKDWCRRIC